MMLLEACHKHIMGKIVFRWMEQVCKCRHYSQYLKEVKGSAAVRNIGILAHIDAGKTTTTERMLFYSGKILHMGEVHHGNTVTDFMEQERERGITISSAAVSFPWKKYQFNLIDTPGHIDFTMEVERTLSILDGVIVILDGSAGVEAQTLTVWRQADQHNLPRIVYLNKMDRQDACMLSCLNSLQSKLKVIPLALQHPLYCEDGRLEGVADIVTMQALRWSKEDKEQGRVFQCKSIDTGTEGELWETISAARRKLVEQLADCDDSFAELVISSETLDIPAEVVLQTLRKVTLEQKAVPVLCGSSYKNIGVQLLMDAVVYFLPSPDHQSQHLFHCFQDALCARAFKVVHDDQKKPVTFFRIYTGAMKKGQKIYNIQKEKTEQLNKLMVAYADESIEVSEVTSGNIAAVIGLKHTVTGDFVTTSAASAAAARKKFDKYRNGKGHEDFGHSTRVPTPVFFCSIEAPSQAYQTHLDQALEQLQREDPSLTVVLDEATGQTIIGGMGELHIEIIKNRLISEYKIDVYLGRLQIAYQEIPKAFNIKETSVVNHKIGNSLQNMTITLSLLEKKADKEDILLLDRSPDNASNIDTLSPRLLKCIERGIENALTRGPKLCFPVVNACFMLHNCHSARSTSESVVSATASQCVQKILQTVGTHLMEPVMQLEAVAEKDHTSVVLADLSRRRAKLQQVTPRGTHQVIEAQVPLAELLGYATDLRTLTSGSGSFSMELDCYQQMTTLDEAKAIKNVTGFDP